MTRVITRRLWDKLSPLERDLYQDQVPLRRYLVVALYPHVRDEMYDSYDLEDFVQYGLLEAQRYELISFAAVAFWVKREIRRRKRRDQAYVSVERLERFVDPHLDEMYTDALPPDVAEWVRLHVWSDRAQAVMLMVERDLTVTQAAKAAGVEPWAVYDALKKLRKAMEDDGNDIDTS